MAKINRNYLKLPGSYLFSTIGRKVREYEEAHPEAKLIRLGIGDVSLSLCDAVIKALHEENPTLEWNIFGSIHNVQLDTMVGWKYKGKEISFLDGYDEAKGGENHGIQ